MAYRTVYNPKLGRYVRRRTRSTRRRTSALGGIGALGSGSSLRGMMTGLKGVIITGGIAAGGAIATDSLYDKIGGSLNLSGWQRNLAKIATGIALGIVIGKVLKKPRLAAAFAIGPVVAGMMRIFADVLGTGSVAGLGLSVYQDVDRYTTQYAPTYDLPPLPAPGLGSVAQYGNGVPESIRFPGVKPRAPYAMPAM